MISDKPDSGSEAQRHYVPRIADMNKDDTPRERAGQHGVKVLSTPDLWAIILRTGTVGNPITSLCRELMDANGGSLHTLARRSEAELQSIKGLGKLKALQIQAVNELIARYNAEKSDEDPVIQTSAQAVEIIRNTIGSIPHEEVWALMLNRANRVVRKFRCSVGGTASSIFDVRILMKATLLENCSGIILCHNHPSGQLRPSPQDDAITRKCKEAAAFFDIRLFDHIIVTDSGYYSYADQGRL